MSDTPDGDKREADTVRLRWLAVPDGTDALARGLMLLDAAERERANRFQFAEDRAAYVAAHALARTLLAEVGGLPPKTWRFVCGPHGKPEIDPALDRPGLRFNISHTRGFVAAAVTWGGTLGIDVEMLDRRRAPNLDIADRFFAPGEIAWLRAAPAAEALEVFFRFWTLKEAFIKATGEGLARPLDSFAFALDALTVTFNPPEADEPALWRFASLRPTARHLLAVARRRSAPHRLALDVSEAVL